MRKLQKVAEQFTKDNLRNGMVVETRERKAYIVLENNLIDTFGFLPLDNFDDNLKGRYSNGKDIVKVYEPILRIDDFYNRYQLEVLWSRPEVKEVTMSEVEEKFGYKVKIVKEPESR